MNDFFAEERAPGTGAETQKQAGHSRGVAGALWWASHFTDEETGTE